MKKLIFLLLVLPLGLFAQFETCDEKRFIESVFDDVTITRGIQYGEAVTLAGATKELILDVFEPEGDEMEVRPLLVVAHGGAFVTGSPEEIEDYCIEFAKRGYVCANINYRLIDKIIFDSVAMAEAVVMAVNDMRAAVRYFREDIDNGNSYRVANDYIFAAGVSAGAIMANHLGFYDKNDEVPEYFQTIVDNHGGFEGNSSENTQYSSHVAGVLNYSGGLYRDYWVDADDAPVYSAHDDMDPTVPCSYSKSNVVPFPVYLYGSCDIKEVADKVGVNNQLYLVENSTGHVSYFEEEASRNRVINESTKFLAQIICNGLPIGINDLLANELSFSVYPNPVQDILTIKTEATVQKIVVNNVLGQARLYVNNVNGNRINLSELNCGVYMLHIETDQGQLVSRVIKQ